MKNSILDREARVLGETAGRDLTPTLHDQLDDLFDDQLEQAIIGLKRDIDGAHARLLAMVEELDRRQIPATEHRLSTMNWLGYFCRMSPSEASGITKAARSLAHMPQVEQAALAGDVPSASLRVLAQARDRHPDAFAAHESVFAELATSLDARDLRRAVSYWEQQIDYPAALDTAASLRDQRRLFLHQTYEGMWSAFGDLDPESGHVVSTALRSHTDPANLDPDDRRAVPQRTADALVDICRFWLDHNRDITTSGGERPHITVTVPYATLTGNEQRLGEIGGGRVDPEVIRRLACDAGIVRVVVDGEGQPLDVGRRVRTASPAIRRALELRDEGCAWAGCDAPASWCDAHHITHWADGGVTALSNLILLCRRHHGAVHRGGRPPDP
jgi:hypothetical protein